MLEHILKIRELLKSRGVAEVVKYLRVRGLGHPYFEARPGFAPGISFVCEGLSVEEWREVERAVREWKSRRCASHEGHSVHLQHEAERDAMYARAFAAWESMRPYPLPMTAVFHAVN